MTNWAEYEQVDKIADSFNRGYEKAKAKFLQSLEQVKPLGEEEIAIVITWGERKRRKGKPLSFSLMGDITHKDAAQAAHQNVIDQIEGMLK